MTMPTNNVLETMQAEFNSTDENLSSSSNSLTPTGIISPLQRTPTKNHQYYAISPTKKVVGDRFIPLRDFHNWQSKIALSLESKSGFKKDEVLSPTRKTYPKLLRNEIFDIESRYSVENCAPSESTRLFQYSSPTKDKSDFQTASSERYSLSPVSCKSQNLLQARRRDCRKIPLIPFKVLDAPDLQDDFYLNLLDWSSQNVLSVGLGPCVYLWSATTSQVSRLCDLESNVNLVTSVCWNNKGNLIAVGTNCGYTHIWDVTKMKKINVLPGHAARIGTLAWNQDLLASGSRDRLILVRDMRAPRDITERKYIGHRQEVCGLKWSPDGRYLASGGNDNRVYVWSLLSSSPFQSYFSHTAAVKAIAWSPHQHGLLASGGGTADRYIRFWNTLTGQSLQAVDTGSQVCNIVWSKNSSELVSTHGYTQNQIYIWSYPNMTQIAKLMGHSLRVLYIAMSPSGETIVTGAGDETLRFWNVFTKPPSLKVKRSILNLFTSIR